MSKSAGLSEVKLSISIPVTGYRRRMLFTRFSLQRIEGHILAHFGLLDESGILRDSFSCAFSKQTLQDSKAGLTGLLAKVGGPQTTPQKWTPPVGSENSIAAGFDPNREIAGPSVMTKSGPRPESQTARHGATGRRSSWSRMGI